MGRTCGIINTLEFYVLANKLKSIIIDDENNYSIADHLYGSVILAAAIHSEFKESKDLAKTYRMILLSEFSKCYPDYSYDHLNLGSLYKEESLNLEVDKYKKLDLELTKLLNSNLSEDELLKEGSNIIASACNKKLFECEEIFKFYKLNTSLKNKVRSGWDENHWNVKTDRKERISEHVTQTMYLSIIMSSEFRYSFNTNKVLEMLAIHEIGEILIGDITPFDGVTKENKHEIEHKAMKMVLGNLKDNEEMYELLLEFDEQKTLESINGHYIDKIEADLQAKDYQDRKLHHSLDDQANNCVFKSPKALKMVEDGATTAFDIWYEWDKTIYVDPNFPEFLLLLNYAKERNFLELYDCYSYDYIDTFKNAKTSLIGEDMYLANAKRIRRLREESSINVLKSGFYEDEKNIKRECEYLLRCIIENYALGNELTKEDENLISNYILYSNPALFGGQYDGPSWYEQSFKLVYGSGEFTLEEKSLLNKINESIRENGIQKTR